MHAARGQGYGVQLLTFKRRPLVPAATVRTTFTAALEASLIAGMKVDVAVEPPEVGPGGSELLPRTTFTLSTGMPVLSLTI